MPGVRPTVDDILGADHNWYHVMDLGDGVTTPGHFDMRPHVGAVGFPDDLHGKRAVDVGTFDGFWAFEMERRGAEVVGIDIDEVPPPDTPEIHRERLREAVGGRVPGTGIKLLIPYFGSTVRRVSCNLYDLTPEAVGGPADLIFCGALLEHLRDPVGGLEAIRRTLAPGGQLISFEYVIRTMPWERRPIASFQAHRGHGWSFWHPSVAALRGWMRAAGFTRIERRGVARFQNETGDKFLLQALHAWS